MNIFDVYSIYPIEIAKAKGSWVWDAKGIQYLDMYGGHAVISIGHLHDYWVSMLKNQLDHIAFYSNSVIIPQQVELAKKLCQQSGKSEYHLFLCNSGAEANENALKLASFHNGKKKIISFTGGFHGRTSLAVAVTDNPKIIATVNENENVIILPFNDIDSLRQCFKTYGDEISSIIVEGIQGVGGIQEASIGFLQTIRQLCDQYNTIYIADSVQCGYGRTGQFFAHDIAEVEADIYTMAKGMGNGFPIGGILIHPKIKAEIGMLGTTFGGNHLACAAGIAVLDVFSDHNLIKKAKDYGDLIIQRLRQYPEVKTVRGRGLMIGFEMQEPYAKNFRSELLWSYRIFTGVAKNNTIRLLPALSITEIEINHFFAAFESLIAHHKKQNQ